LVLIQEGNGIQEDRIQLYERREGGGEELMGGDAFGERAFFQGGLA
jgi:hypothetical protein